MIAFLVIYTTKIFIREFFNTDSAMSKGSLDTNFKMLQAIINKF